MKSRMLFVCLAACLASEAIGVDVTSVVSAFSFLRGGKTDAPEMKVVNHEKTAGAGYEPGDSLYVSKSESKEEQAIGSGVFIVSTVITFVPFAVALFLGARANSWLNGSSLMKAATNGESTTKKPKRSLYERLFLTQHNAVFAADAELALRGAVFAIITAIPFLCPQLRWLWQSGRYGASAVVMFLFTLYKSVGETINFAFVGMVGTVLAVLNVWILFGIFPGGVNGTSSASVWYIGATNAFIFGFLIMVLNLDNSLRMFALSWHVYFLMTFLNPAANTFNDSFSVSVTGPAVSALLMSGVGAGMAIIATLVPYPIYSLDKARACAFSVAGDVAEAWEETVRCFGSDVKNRALHSAIQRQLNEVPTQLTTLTAHLGNAWWECVGSGTCQKVRIFLGELDHVLRESYHRLCTLEYMCEECTYSANHKQVMATMKPSLAELAKNNKKLLVFVTEAAADGVFDSSEIDQLNQLTRAVTRSVQTVTEKFEQVIKGLDEDLVDVIAFVRSYCVYGQKIVAFAGVLTDMESAAIKPEVPSIMNLFDRSVITDPTHVNFVVRNGLSLLIAFIIGYRGHSAILMNYNSGPAGTVSLLLSSFVGAAIVKNLGRLQGAVLGTCLGQVAYAYLAWCDFVGYLSVGTFVFLWCILTLFVYYNSSEYGYIGCLLAAFGVQSVLMGCSDDVFHPHGTYHMIINTIMGIGSMTLCDLCLSPARSSELASSKLLAAWGTFTRSWTEVFDVSNPKIRFHAGTFRNLLVACDGMGVQASLEPRFHRTPFKGDLYTNVTLANHKMREFLCNMEVSCTEDAKDGSEKAAWLRSVMQMESFTRVFQDFKGRMETIKALLGIFSHETQQPFVHLAIPNEEELNKRENAKNSRALLSEFIQEAKRTVAVREAGEFALFFVCLKAQLQEMIELKEMILSY